MAKVNDYYNFIWEPRSGPAVAKFNYGILPPEHELISFYLMPAEN
jgi:hypothetical protein